MKNDSMHVPTLAQDIRPLLGHSIKSAEVQDFLERLGFDRFQDFEEEESTIYLEDKLKGFWPHPQNLWVRSGSGRPPRL